MSADEFWNIVDHVHSLSPDDMKTKCKNLDVALRKLPVEEILDFERHFARFYYQAYRWDLWDAAVTICHGCGDDSFMDFRSTLISMGKTAYMNALAEPESLADTNIDPEWARFEGYQYVSPTILREILGDPDDRPRDPNVPEEERAHPRRPVGKSVNEWELSKRFPRLAAKFGHQDSSWFNERDRQKREEQKQQSAEAVADLLLRAQLIPPNGLIAPYKLLRPILQNGSAREITGNNASWEPFDLDEGAYWATLVNLESFPSEKLARWPHLIVTKLKHDVTTNAATFANWYHSVTK